jgi:hypothetical protein
MYARRPLHPRAHYALWTPQNCKPIIRSTSRPWSHLTHPPFMEVPPGSNDHGRRLMDSLCRDSPVPLAESVIRACYHGPAPERRLAARVPRPRPQVLPDVVRPARTDGRDHGHRCRCVVLLSIFERGRQTDAEQLIPLAVQLRSLFRPGSQT